MYECLRDHGWMIQGAAMSITKRRGQAHAALEHATLHVRYTYVYRCMLQLYAMLLDHVYRCVYRCMLQRMGPCPLRVAMHITAACIFRLRGLWPLC